MKCWAFNPPGGLVSRNVNKVMDPFCISIIVGKDAVSRGSVNNLSRLMDEMVTALARCRSASQVSGWLAGKLGSIHTHGMASQENLIYESAPGQLCITFSAPSGSSREEREMRPTFG